MSNLYTNESPPRQSDKFEFLNLRLLPGKVDYRQAGYILAFEPVAIQRLVALGYLKPLGNNAGTEHKYFSTQRKAPASITDQKRFADELPSIKADGGGQFGGKSRTLAAQYSGVLNGTSHGMTSKSSDALASC